MGLRIVFNDCTVRLEARQAAGLNNGVLITEPVLDVELFRQGQSIEKTTMNFAKFLKDIGVEAHGVR